MADHIKPLLTVPEAAKRMGISESTLWRYIRQKKIRVMRFSARCLRIKPIDIDRCCDAFSYRPITER